MPLQHSPHTVTRLLVEWSHGNGTALDELAPLVYRELHRIAESFMRHERADHTLQPTALVHEAFLRLVDQREVNWQNRAQFFGVAVQMMRRILVNHARDRHAAKRGGGELLLSLDETIDYFAGQDVNLMLLDEALNALARIDEQQSRIVELRFFGGLNIEETAEVVRVSPATVKREWRIAKAWLYGEINGRGDPS